MTGPFGASLHVLQLSVMGTTRVLAHVRAGIVMALNLRPKERAVLAAIAFDHPRVTSVDRVVELVWGSEPPPTARKAVHNHVHRLRRAHPDLLVTTPDGYRLGDDTHVDVNALEALAMEPAPTESTELEIANPSEIVAIVGEAFADLALSSEVVSRRARLRDVGGSLADRRLQLEIDQGRYDSAAVMAEALIEIDPYRERRWSLLILALARTGRRRDSLQAANRARTWLASKGLEPGDELRQLERRVIDDDPTLAGSASRADTPRRDGTGSDRRASLIGVDRSIEALTAWMGSAAAGVVAVVTGAAGAGKTTTLGEFARRARDRGISVNSTRCTPSASSALEPVVDLLEQIGRAEPDRLRRVAGASALGVLSPSLAAIVGRPEGVVDRQAMFAVLEEVMTRLPPRLMIIDDVHWAPPLTLQALQRIATTCRAGNGTGPWIVMATRPAALESLNSVSRVEVPVLPWTVDDINEWLGDFDSLHPAGEVAAWLLERSGGLPLFVRELTLTLLEQRTMTNGRFTPPREVPAAISAALATRVARLSRAATRALETASILGQRCSRAQLVAMLGGSQAGIDEVLGEGMLTAASSNPDVLAFEHDLLHQVVDERLSAATRAELHDIAFTVLGDDQQAGDHLAAGLLNELARHALGAATLDRHRAIDVAIRAGHDASSRFFRPRAAELWLAAADLLDAEGTDPGGACELRVLAGEQLHHVGDPDALAVLFAAADEAMRLGRWSVAAHAAIVLCRVGPTSAAGTNHDAATRLAHDVLARLDAPGLRAALSAAATTLHSMSGEADLCRRLFADAISDADRDGTDETWVAVLPYTYQSLSGPADLDLRKQLTGRLMTSATRLGDGGARWSALHLMFSNQLQDGDPALWDTAAALDELTPVVRETNREWENHYVQAAAAHLGGQLEESEAIISASLAFAETIAESRVMAVYGVQLLALRLAQRRLSELYPSIAALAEQQPGVVAWSAALAVAAAQAGDHNLACAAFDRAIGHGGRGGLAHDQTYTAALVCLGEAAIELDDRRRSAIIEPLLVPWSGRWSWSGTCTLGPIDTTLSGLARLAGEVDRASALAGQSRASAGRLHAPTFEREAAARAQRRALRR